MRLVFRNGRYLFDQSLPLAPSPAADGVAEAARWQMLFPMGVTRHRVDFGEIAFDKKTLAKMAANFKRDQASHLGDGFGLPITFTHVGSSTPDNHQPIENRRAAGWIEDVEVRDLPAPGLYGLVKWTKEARSRILADEFRYLSPEFTLDATDSDSGKSQGPTLYGAGLLNDPFLKEMPRVAASNAVPPAAPSATQGARKMEKICALLGLPADASESDVMAAIEALKGKPAEAAAQVAAVTASANALKVELSNKGTELTMLGEQNKSLKEQFTAISAKFVEAEKAKFESDTTALCRQLIDGGKIKAHQQDGVKEFCAKLGVEKVREFYKDSATVVPIGTAGTDAPPPASPATVQEARTLYFAEVDRLRSTGMKTSDATRATRQKMPDVARLLFAKALHRAPPHTEN